MKWTKVCPRVPSIFEKSKNKKKQKKQESLPNHEHCTAAGTSICYLLRILNTKNLMINYQLSRSSRRYQVSSIHEHEKQELYSTVSTSWNRNYTSPSLSLYRYTTTIFQHSIPHFILLTWFTILKASWICRVMDDNCFDIDCAS